ncbi:hypothetical protein ACOSP7_009750 [Xanthoceras sorbifolium]
MVSGRLFSYIKYILLYIIKYFLYDISHIVHIFALEVISSFAAEFAELSNITDPDPRILKWRFNKRPNKLKILKHITRGMYAEKKLVPSLYEIDRGYFQNIMQVSCLYPRDGIQTESMPNLDNVAGSSDMV